MQLTVTSTYRKASTTVRPQRRISQAGRSYLRISRRAFRSAESRCAYAGTDGINPDTLTALPGYEDSRAWCISGPNFNLKETA